MRHIISVLLENESGSLSRVAGLFSARSFNIESLSVAPSEDHSASRMTIVTSGDDVIKVSEITSNEHIEREIAFVKINDKDIDERTMSEFSKNEFLKLHKTKKNEVIIECVDSPEKINDFIKSVKKIAVKIVRSGAVGINSN